MLLLYHMVEVITRNPTFYEGSDGSLQLNTRPENRFGVPRKSYFFLSSGETILGKDGVLRYAMSGKEVTTAKAPRKGRFLKIF